MINSQIQLERAQKMQRNPSKLVTIVGTALGLFIGAGYYKCLTTKEQKPVIELTVIERTLEKYDSNEDGVLNRNELGNFLSNYKP